MNRPKKPRPPKKRQAQNVDYYQPFDWDGFLARENVETGYEKYTKAPESVFWQNPVIPENRFQLGRKIALARWRLHPNMKRREAQKTWLLATITDKLHSWLGVKLDGTKKDYQYWLVCDDMDIAPARRILEEEKFEPPIRALLEEEAQDYQKFVEKSLKFEPGQEDPSAPEEWFKPLSTAYRPQENLFQPNMFFEAADARDNDGYLRLVKVVKVDGDLVTLCFVRSGLGKKNWTEKYDSRWFFPPGWAAKAGAKFCPPNKPKAKRKRKEKIQTKFFECTICGTFITSESDKVDEHVEQVHGGDYVPPDAEKCRFCGAQFIDLSYLETHVMACKKNPEKIATPIVQKPKNLNEEQKPTTTLAEISSSTVDENVPSSSHHSENCEQDAPTCSYRNPTKKRLLNLAIKSSNGKKKDPPLKDYIPMKKPKSEDSSPQKIQEPTLVLHLGQKPKSQNESQPMAEEKVYIAAQEPEQVQENPMTPKSPPKALFFYDAATNTFKWCFENPGVSAQKSKASSPGPSTSGVTGNLESGETLAMPIEHSPGSVPEDPSETSKELVGNTSHQHLVDIEKDSIPSQNFIVAGNFYQIVNARSFLTKNVNVEDSTTKYEYPYADCAAPALHLEDPEKRSNEEILAIKQVVESQFCLLQSELKGIDKNKNQILLVDQLFSGLNEQALKNCLLIRANFPFMPSWLINMLSKKRRLLNLIHSKIDTIYYFLGHDIALMYRSETTEYKVNHVVRAITDFIEHIVPEEDEEDDEIYGMKSIVLVTIPAIGLLRDTIKVYNKGIKDEVENLKNRYGHKINIALVDWAEMLEENIQRGAPMSMDDRLKVLVKEMTRYGLKYTK
uniref:C2H2-type domain-containing protein n=1 Tax=Acrobeloides nanus TaxID=290746 RepID=A0A914DRG8_9BILA